MIGVDIQNVVMDYPKPGNRSMRRALNGLSMTIEVGEVRGLLGPNGAGKTTLIKILSTILLPTSGTAHIGGFDIVREVREVRRRIGIVLGGDRGLYWNLTGRQNLAYWAALYGVSNKKAKERIEVLLAQVNLLDRADDLVGAYSRGMKQRLHLARGLVADPMVLFLDEPTSGMDPIAAREFRSLVGDLRREGKTILLTTHDMSEAESICDRVALINHGSLIAIESPSTLSKLIAEFEHIEFEKVGASDLMHEVSRIPGVSRIYALDKEGAYCVNVSEKTAISLVLERLIASGVVSIRTNRPSLEEVYVHLLGENRGRASESPV